MEQPYVYRGAEHGYNWRRRAYNDDIFPRVRHTRVPYDVSTEGVLNLYQTRGDANSLRYETTH